MRRLRVLRASITVAAVLVMIVSTTRVASAGPDVQACLKASESGQHARASGRLREARDDFVVCGNDSCPALVRHDCAQWNQELSSTLPTVVFGAKDGQGRDLFDVSVAMDGEQIVKKLDGKSVTVDPGKHTFRFETAGFPAVTDTSLIKEGERARAINVTFHPPTAPASTTNKPAQDQTGGATDGDGGHTPYPWIVVGAGAVGLAVGIVIVVTTPSRPANCNASTQKCTRSPTSETDADFRKDQETAGTADSQPVLGFIVGGIGLAFIAGGLVWHFLEPVGDPKKAGKMHVTPWTTGKSSGLALGASF